MRKLGLAAGLRAESVQNQELPPGGSWGKQGARLRCKGARDRQGKQSKLEVAVARTPGTLGS